MRVAGGEPDAAFLIDIDARGCDERGMLGEQRHLHAGLQRLDLRREVGGDDGCLRRWGGLGEGGEREKNEGEACHE